MKMMTELCRELNNYFCDIKDIKNGYFSVSGGKIVPAVDLQPGQYFRITGSVFNDGVYINSAATVLKDESMFDGAVWKMSVPDEIINLADRIAEWRGKNENVNGENMSPFQSESFFEYSYTKKGGSSDDSGTAITWKQQFKSELDRYRRARGLRP